MFDDDCEYDNISYDVVECDKHTALNRKMAQESIVLLKNNGILPLSKDVKTIAVIGPNADDVRTLTANYNGTPSRYFTPLRALQDSFDGRVLYAVGCHPYDENSGNWCGNPVREAIIMAEKADVVIMCLGLNPSMEGEEGDSFNGDVAGDKNDILLPPSQRILYDKVMALGKPTVFVNISGSCVSLVDQDERCDAVIQCFYPGAQGGNALADVILGKVSPSGRLPVTFYRSCDDLPPFRDYSMENRTYKFFKGSPLYPFGYGLTYGDIEEKWIDENTVEVSNKGGMDTSYAVLKFESEPNPELIDFKKIFVKVGQTVTVKF
jgi:beta-glucosidase